MGTISPLPGSVVCSLSDLFSLESIGHSRSVFSDLDWVCVGNAEMKIQLFSYASRWPKQWDIAWRAFGGLWAPAYMLVRLISSLEIYNSKGSATAALLSNFSIDFTIIYSAERRVATLPLSPWVDKRTTAIALQKAPSQAKSSQIQARCWTGGWIQESEPLVCIGQEKYIPKQW